MVTSFIRLRTDPIASHEYTLPVVREIPIRRGAPRDPADIVAIEQETHHTADAHPW
jgi:hypothetical protein